MSDLVLVDAFCGLGGCAVGYQRAAQAAGLRLRIVGVDIAPQPDYPFEFHRGDALEFLTRHGHEFDLAHGSAPCQHASGPTLGTNAAKNAEQGIEHPELIEPTRLVFDALGIPYVLENVQGSRLRRDLTLCGLMFPETRQVFRHRWFELGGGWIVPRRVPHPSHAGHRVRGWRHNEWHEGDMLAVYGKGGGKASTAECRSGLGIHWSWDRAQLVEAVPPAYTEFLAAPMFAHLAAERAA